MRRLGGWPGSLVGIMLATAVAGAAGAAHVDPAPIPDEVVRALVRPRLPRPGATVTERLNRHLDEAGHLLRQLEQEDRGPGTPTTATPMLLGSKLHELRTVWADLRSQAAEIRVRLTSHGGREQVAAWDAKLTRLEGQFARIAQALEEVRQGGRGPNRLRALAAARGALRSSHELPREQRRTPPVTPGPTFTQDAPAFQPLTPGGAPPPQYLTAPQAPGRIYAFLGPVLLADAPAPPAEAQRCQYTSADLAETLDVPLTSEIRSLAESLGYSPARLFEYVSNEIAFEPYYGSLKGAMGTLVSKAGNATDQASLLIALLRASKIPARYVKGTVYFDRDPTIPPSQDRLPRWIGAKSQYAAANILAVGRIPTAWYGGATEGVGFAHVWVEACVPYGNYRGAAVDLTGHRWIPLDPSFKDQAYQAGIATSVELDYATYMASRTNTLPHERYAEQVEAYIKAQPPNYANNTLADVGYVGSVVARRLDILPASLPYQVVGFNAWGAGLDAEVAALPDSHRYTLTIEVRNPSDVALAPVTTLAMPQVALQRITLAFRGATPGAQASLEAWKTNTNLAQALPCPLSVVPVIRVEGAEVGVGTTAVDLCTTTNRLTLRLSVAEVTTGSPPGTINSVTYTNIQAGDTHALQAYAFQASDRLLAERAATLLASVRATPNPNANQDETEGEFLHLAGLKYMRYVTDANRRIGEWDGGSGLSGNHLGLTSARSQVEYVFDEPFGIYRSGFLVDVPGGQSRSVDLSTGTLVWKSFKLMGYTGSAYESYLWQENARLDAVSSVRGIQFARESGIEVLTLTSANWNAEKGKLTSNADASLNYASGEVASLENAVNSGFTVIAPRSHIRYQNWTGTVWNQEKDDSAQGSMQAGFIIGGSYAGGYTVAPPEISYSYNPPTLDTGWVFEGPPPSTADPVDTTPPIVNSGVNFGMTPYTTTSGDPVNTVTGNFVHTERDLAIKGRGLPFVFQRTYNSREPKDGPLGFGWTHSFNHALVFSDDNADGVTNAADTNGITDSVAWIDGTGSQKFVRVAGNASGVPIGSTFTAPKGFFFQVARQSDGTYTIREKQGLTYTFESMPGTVGQRARLLRITDRNSNALTLTYGANNLLSAVTDGLGRALAFTYTGTRLTELRDWTNRTHQYLYDGHGNLVTYKNPLAVAGSQNPVTYAYYSDAALAHMMRSYTLPRGNGMTFEYYMNGKVFTHYTSLGQTTTFTYNDFRRETVVVNERGHTRRFFFDENGNPVKIVEENGGERIYTYDKPNNPMNRLTKRDPMGYTTTYAYDANGNVTRIGLPSGSTIEYGAFTAFNQPGKVKDARGNYTIQKYDARGNLLDVLRLRSGVGASADPTTYAPNAADLVAWTKYTHDPFGNLATSKQVRDFATQAGPTVEFDYTDTVNSVQGLNAVGITRRGDKDGDGTIDAAETATLAYDTLGRVTTGLGRDWYATQAAYDAVDRVVRGTDAVGQLRDYDYDANGNPVSERLVDGGSTLDEWTATYDLADRQVSRTNAGGYTTRYAYDAAGNPLTVTNPDGYTLTFSYDPNNRVLRAADQEGNALTSTRDLDGKPRTLTDPNGSTVTFTYYGPERDGRLKERKDALGRTTTFDYDAHGNVTTVTDNLGRTTSSTYDELDRPTRIVGPAYSDATYGTIRPVTRNSYDTLGRLIRVEAGRTDAAGTNPATDVVAVQMSYLYDDFGRRLQETDPLNRTWRFTYDLHGNPLSVTDPKGNTITATYGYGHQLLTRTARGPAGGPTLVALTRSSRTWTEASTFTDTPLVRRVTPIRAPHLAELRQGIDALRARHALGPVAWQEAIVPGLTPVKAAHLTELREALSSLAATLGRPAPSYTDPSLVPRVTAVKAVHLQELRAALLALDPLPGDHRYATDGTVPAGYADEGLTGYLRQATDVGTRALTRYVNATGSHFYSATGSDVPAGYAAETILGYLDATSGPGLVPLARFLNAGTNDYLLDSSTSPPPGYTYQATLGYVRIEGSPATGSVTAYTRNALGQVTQVSTPGVTYSYTYDQAHRLQSVTDSRGLKRLAYGYSPGGQLTTLRDSDGGTSSYGYDPVGRLTGIWAPNGESVTLSYDAGGRLTEKTFPNGASTRYAYHADNTLAQLITRLGSSVISQHDYTYDGVGNRVTHSERIGETVTPYRYVYDPLNRLTEVRDNATKALIEGYSYDPLGNRLTKTDGLGTTYYFHDGANQVTKYCLNDALCANPAHTFAYDPNGNLAVRVEGSSTTSFAYDPENRLAWVGATGQLPQRYAYDDQGRRIRKLFGATATQYLYHGPSIAAEYDSTWLTPTARYTHGPGIDHPLIRVTATSTDYYHADGLGSIVAASTPTGGTEATVRYDAWGATIASTGKLPRYGYTGREPDETGLLYYRARYYDPSIGRFTQRDPLRLPSGENPYGYVDNSPTNYKDPEGLLPVDTLVDVGFIAYDIYSLIRNPSLTSLAALALDVAGAALPYVTGLGAAYRLRQVANRADVLDVAGKTPQVAGTLKHSEAARIIEREIPHLKTEQVYKAGDPLRTGARPRGSKVADVVEGPVEQPTRIFDFKFGEASLTEKRIGEIQEAVGFGVPVHEIRPGPLAPRTGMGAALNAAEQVREYVGSDETTYSGASGFSNTAPVGGDTTYYSPGLGQNSTGSPLK